MKQNIKVGNVVDDGQGDYLRRAGQKINSNFDDIYSNLGDGERPFAAGSWKSYDGVDGILSPLFGEAYTLNTTQRPIVVNLPKGSPSDYNKVIRLRDVFKSWSINAVTVTPASGDTMKGQPSAVDFYRDYTDLELVYCSPGRWEWVANKSVDRITSADMSTVAKRSVIATEGQKDFPDVFGSDTYNSKSVEVYKRGNLLYYGDVFSDDSQYGSIDPTDPDNILPLDGQSIRLRHPCEEDGDTVQFVTYLDGIATFRSSYTSKTVKVRDTSTVVGDTTPGELIVGDLATMVSVSVSDLGLGRAEAINPNTCEIYINGNLQTRSGTAMYPEFYCEDDPTLNESDCLANSMNWVRSDVDYSFGFDSQGNIDTIRFPVGRFSDQDVLVVKWYNNEIGSLMDWDGEGGIKEHTDELYLNNEQVVMQRNKIEYTDYNNPTPQNVRPLPDPVIGRVLDVQGMFDLLYPIGTIYKNAHNPANPADYMGLGVWQRYAEAQFIAGWNSTTTDGDFSLNKNDLDSSGNPKNSAGGTGGQRSVELSANNIPVLTSEKSVLVSNNDGSIVIGGCEVDPDASGPGYTKYIEAPISVNDANPSVDSVGVLPPFVTAYVWLRVA